MERALRVYETLVELAHRAVEYDRARREVKLLLEEEVGRPLKAPERALLEEVHYDVELPEGGKGSVALRAGSVFEVCAERLLPPFGSVTVVHLLTLAPTLGCAMYLAELERRNPGLRTLESLIRQAEEKGLAEVGEEVRKLRAAVDLIHLLKSG